MSSPGREEGGAPKSHQDVICGERLEDEITPQDQAGSVLRQGD